MLFRLRLLRLIQDKSNFWTLIIGVLGIGVALIVVGLDDRYEYHFQFMAFSLIILIFAAIMFGLYSGSDILTRDLRKDRFKYPIKIGILRGLVRENDFHTCLFHGGPSTQHNMTEQKWQNHLQGNHYEVSIISVADINDTFSIILNPFGEAYPEEDIATRRSFHRIRKYIEEGGIFLNTSGIAFYYMWDSTTGRRYITGTPLETYEISNNLLFPVELGGQTSVSHSWMNENFGIRTTIGRERDDTVVYQSGVDAVRFGNIADIGGTNLIQEYRAALYGPKLIPLLRAVISVGNYQAECYPIAVSKMGIGYLVVSGFTPNSIGWVDKITISLYRLCDRIMQIGSIE